MHVAVVGAGILGASAAWHLVRAGARVTVVDAADEGRATAAGAGIICPWVSGDDDPAFYRLYCDGGAYYREIIPALAEDGETDLGFGRVGALVVSDDAEELSALYRLLQQRQADTPEIGEVRRLAAREARVLFPPLRADLAAVYVSCGGRVDGRRMAAGLLRAAQRRGAVLFQGHAELIEHGIRLNGETIIADRVIVAAGAWAPEVLRPLGVTLRIEPQRGQIVHLRLPGQDTAAWPVIFPLSGHYLLAFDDSRVVVGATREPGVGFDYRVTAAGQAEVPVAGAACGARSWHGDDDRNACGVPSGWSGEAGAGLCQRLRLAACWQWAWCRWPHYRAARRTDLADAALGR